MLEAVQKRRPRRFISIMCLACLGLFCLTTRAGPLDVWHPRNPPFSNDAERAIAFGMGTFVALDSGNSLLSSLDGLRWSRLPTEPGVKLSGVAFGNNRFVARGESGVVLVSTNLLDWSRYSLPGGGDGVRFVHDRFFAVAGGTRLMSSFDGQNWTLALNAPQAHGIAYGNGRFVAIGWGDWQGIIDPPPPYGPEMFYSTNGFDWVLARKPDLDFPVLGLGPRPVEFHDIAFGNGSFVAAAKSTDRTSSGYIARSLTAESNSWSSVHFLGAWSGLTRMEFLGGRFLGWAEVGFTGGLFVSTNGLDWSVIPDGYAQNNPNGWNGGADMEFGNGIYVTVSRSSASPPRVSTNLLTWQSAPQGGILPEATLGQIIRGHNGYFIPGGPLAGGSAFSPNGREWKVVASNRKIGNATYGNGGYWGLDFLWTVVFSSDGVNWRERSRMTDPLIQLMSISASDDRVFIGGSRQREPGSTQFDRYHAVSADGRTWEPALGLGQFSLSGTRFVDGRFVGLGYPQAPAIESRLFTSPDGRVWQAVITVPEPVGHAGFFVAGGRYILSAGPLNAPFCLTSTNLTDWQRHSTPERFVNMVYGQGVYLALSERALWSSTDFKNWTRHVMPAERIYGLPTARIVSLRRGRWAESMNQADWTGCTRFGCLRRRAVANLPFPSCLNRDGGARRPSRPART